MREAGSNVMREWYQDLKGFVRRLDDDKWDAAVEEGVEEGYLVEIFRYWRKFTGRRGARRFEDVWEYVAGRPILWE